MKNPKICTILRFRVSFGYVEMLVLFEDMTIAEMIKEITDAEEFTENIRNEHEMILGMVADRVHPYIEDCMAHKVDIVKVYPFEVLKHC